MKSKRRIKQTKESCEIFFRLFYLSSNAKKETIMNTKILSVVLFIFAAQISIFAQSEKEVAAVRAEVKSINGSSKKLKKEMKTVLGLSLEGAEATYFLSGKEIKKITATFYGETYKSTAEVYYRTDAPIFIFSKLNKYDAPINPNRSPKIISSEEQRIYFSGGKTVKIIVGKADLKTTDSRFAEIESSLTEISQGLIKAYSEKE